MTGRPRLAIVAVALFVVALPPGSEAKLTIGSNLSGTPTSDSAEGTWVNAALEDARRAPGGLRSPVKGVITRWRIKTGDHTAPIALRVIRPLRGGLFTGAGTSGIEIPAANTTSVFPAHVVVPRGALIGTNTVRGLVTQIDTDASPNYTQLLFWFDPSLGDGVAGSYPNVNAGGYVSLVNADIEPASRFRVKQIKALADGGFWIAVVLPNQGTLRAGGEKIPVLGPGKVRMRVGPGRRISFTPIHGEPFTRSLRPTPGANPR
jgi:hypothetical protein